ncbi:MAG: FtsW/RodA/SpoVE family cell cycle protein, partial [Endozoicomonadaceae bacterium]|nr:FtsW/RodA/SpoVE family cell cycle protein [Endozoicomonadaceae bacterium]
YLDPWNNPFDSGYQLTQALIAIGRGSWLGEGLGQSIQKLSYLPEAHTDFIFSILAEEFGLLGILLILFLLLRLVYCAFKIGAQCSVKKSHFAACLAYSIALLWLISIFMNIGVNLGLLPTKGLALPFFSYGGSHILASCCMSGLLLRIQYELKTTHLTDIH